MKERRRVRQAELSSSLDMFDSMLGWRASLGVTGAGALSVTSSPSSVGMVVGLVLTVALMLGSAGRAAMVLSVEAMMFAAGSMIVHSFPNELGM
jgi:hypothetical protein